MTEEMSTSNAELGAAQADGVEAVTAASDTVPEADTASSAVPSPSEHGGSTESRETGSVEDDLVREGDIAADYLERLLDIIDYDGDIDLDVENGRAMVAVVGGKSLAPLVGNHGLTVDALQELVRLAVTTQTGNRSRLMLDIGGYRAGRRAELAKLAQQTATTVLDRREPVQLAPMNAFERKVVHDAVAQIDGVQSASEGQDPSRAVVVSCVTPST